MRSKMSAIVPKTAEENRHVRPTDDWRAGHGDYFNILPRRWSHWRCDAVVDDRRRRAASHREGVIQNEGARGFGLPISCDKRIAADEEARVVSQR